MKFGRPSTTATWVSFMRGLATLDAGALAHDPIAQSLVPGGYARVLRLAARSPIAGRLVRRAWDVIAQGRTEHIALRTRAIDDAIDAAVDAGARQLVLVGAGLDGRAWRMPVLTSVVVFELDHPASQAYKRAKTQGLPLTARAVRFLEVDLERESIARALLRGGHDPIEPTIFVLEGLTMYLTKGALELALRSIAAESAPGSTLVLTYAERRTITPRLRVFASVVRSVGEPIRTLLTQDEARELCARFGFTVLTDEGDTELGDRLGVGRDAAGAPASSERVVCARAVARVV